MKGDNNLGYFIKAIHNFDSFEKILLVTVLYILTGLLIGAVIIFFILKYRKKIIKRNYKIVAFVLLFVIIVLAISIKTKYVKQIDIKSVDFNQIELCYEKCIKINPTEDEIKVFKENLPKYYFGYKDHYFNTGWTNNDIFKSRSVKVKLGDIELICDYNSLYKPNYEITLLKNSKYYSFSENNDVTTIFDKYMLEYKDILTQNQ